jgi:repressor LexA
MRRDLLCVVNLLEGISVKFTEKLDMLMKERGLSRMSLSKESGIPYMTIVNFYEKGTDNIKLSTLRKLADFFGVSIDYLADDEYDDRMTPLLGEMVNVPIVGQISCGNGSIAFDDIEDFEPIPKEWVKGGEYFFLRAKGDSMTGARIYDGDLVLIRKQPDVENGDIAAILIGEEAYLKRVYKHDGMLILHSENPNYQPIFAPPAEVRIVGKLKINVIKY